MVTHCDLFQTILEHVGLPVSAEERAERRYPGRSFRDLCRGDARGGWRDHVFGEYGIVRMIRTRQHKLVRRYPDGPSQLFDLARDPRETQNFLEDPEYRVLAEALTERLEAYFAAHEEASHSGLRAERASEAQQRRSLAVDRRALDQDGAGLV